MYGVQEQECVATGSTVAFFFLSLSLSHKRGGLVINWCFEPRQPVGIIITGLKEEISIKRHKGERTNKAGRTESEKGELSGEFME